MDARSYWGRVTVETRDFLCWYADRLRLGITPTAEDWDAYNQARRIPALGCRAQERATFFHPAQEVIDYITR